MPETGGDFAALQARARGGDRAALDELARTYEPKFRLVARVLLGPALRPSRFRGPGPVGSQESLGRAARPEVRVRYFR
jgi:hypothetical protein